MNIGPLSPVNFAAGTQLAQAKGAAAERAAQAAEAHARLVDGQQRSASAAQVDGTLGDNSVTDDHESAPWQAPSERPAGESTAGAGPVDRNDRPDRDDPLDRELGTGLDLTA
jgi:hypothetical protein